MPGIHQQINGLSRPFQYVYKTSDKWECSNQKYFVDRIIILAAIEKISNYYNVKRYYYVDISHYFSQNLLQSAKSIIFKLPER